MKPTRRTIALSVATAAIVVLGIAVVVGKDRIIEEWHLHLLVAGNEVEREEALRALVRLRSPRAARHLIETLRALAPFEEELRCKDTGPGMLLGKGAGAARLEETLVEIGEPAIPELLRALGTGDQALTISAGKALQRIRDPRLRARSTVLPPHMERRHLEVALQALAREASRPASIRRAAADAMQRIEDEARS